MNDLQRETNSASGSGARLAPSQDLVWERELVQLVSTLDSFRARLHDDCQAGRLLPAVQTTIAVAKGFAAFLRPRFPEAPASLQASADAFFAAARPLHRRVDDNVFWVLVRLLWRRRDLRGPGEQFLEVLDRLRSFLQNGFDLCASRFLAPSSLQSWTEMYMVFLAELDGVAALVRP